MKRILAILAFTALATISGCGGGGRVVDNLPPRIENLRVTPSDLIAAGSQISVQVEVTDDISGVKEVSLVITYPDGQSQTIVLAKEGDKQFSANFNANWNDTALPENFEDWVVRFRIVATDNSNNQSQSEVSVRAAIGPPQLPPDF